VPEVGAATSTQHAQPLKRHTLGTVGLGGRAGS